MSQAYKIIGIKENTALKNGKRNAVDQTTSPEEMLF